MNPIKTRLIRARLQNEGFLFVRCKGSHEHWRCPTTNRKVMLVNSHKEISGPILKDIYKQANWPFEDSCTQAKLKEPVRKIKSFADLKQLPIRIDYDNEPIDPPVNKMFSFSLDEKIEIVDLAEKEGDLVAAEHYNMPLFRVKQWRKELGATGQEEKIQSEEVPQQNEKVKALEPTAAPEQKAMPIRDTEDLEELHQHQGRKTLTANAVHDIAKRLIAGQTGSAICKEGIHDASLPTVYEIAKGNHKLLTPELVSQLEIVWARRKKESCFVGAAKSAEAVSRFYDLVVNQGRSLTYAAGKCDISLPVARRIMLGNHRNLTAKQAEGIRLYRQRKENNGKMPQRPVVNFEMEKLRKENAELRQALKEALDLVLQSKRLDG